MGGGRWEGCCFIRSGQGRPLSKSPFELRSRGGKIMGHMGKEHSSQWTENTKAPKQNMWIFLRKVLNVEESRLWQP